LKSVTRNQTSQNKIGLDFLLTVQQRKYEQSYLLEVELYAYL